MRFLPHITNNWHVKLLSVGLAFILYVYVNSLQEEEQFLTIDLQVRNVAPGYVVSSDIPETVKVVLNGRAEKLALVEEERIHAFLDLQNTTKRSVNRLVHLGQQDIPQGVSVKEVSPRLVEVSLEKAEVKSVDVVPVIEGEPPLGFALENVELDPERIGVEGPASRLADIRNVYTEQIDISRIHETTVMKVALEAPGGPFRLMGSTHVKARIVMREEFVIKKVSLEQIRIEHLPEGLIAMISESAAVSALIRIPRRREGVFNGSQVYAAADCSEVTGPGDHLVPLGLGGGGEHALVVNIQPPEIQIRVEKTDQQEAGGRAQ
jgi:YbbR domain-containing protein